MKLPGSLLPVMIALSTSAPWGAQEEISLARARTLLQQEDAAGAASVLRELTAREPDNAAAWAMLAANLQGQGDLDGAVEAGRHATRLDPSRPLPFYNLACALARQQAIDEALDCLRQAAAAGFDNRGQALSDPDLAPLRADARFADSLPPLHEGSEAFVETPRVLHEWRGEAANDQFGWVARRVGDLDGDGATDFVTSAPTHSEPGKPGCGRIYAYSSRSGELLFQRDGGPGDGLGNGVASCGDINADGTPDFIIGAPSLGGGTGKAHVFSGADFAELHTVSSPAKGDRFGMKVGGVEDLDGDGHDEFLVGAPNDDSAGQDAGRVWVFSGASGEELFHLDGEAAGDNFGSCVDGTRAGEHYLIGVGAMQAGDRKQGRAYVYRVEDARPELFFTIDGDATSRNLGQYFLCFCGDVDADGFPDVYCSDWNNSARGPSTGRVFVHSGFDGELLLTLTGHVAGEGFGTSISNADDVNGDGHADFAVGAWQHASAARSGGKVYLHSGKDGALLDSWTGRQAGDTLGFDAQGIGDVDGDGCVDYLLTSAWSETIGPQTGRVFLIAGTVAMGDAGE